jgi:hypothetical protein
MMRHKTAGEVILTVQTLENYPTQCVGPTAAVFVEGALQVFGVTCEPF